MNIAKSKIELAQMLFNTYNKQILKTIATIFDQSNDSFDLSTEEKLEIDRRLDDIKNGKSKSYTWDDVKRRIRNSNKKSNAR